MTTPAQMTVQLQNAMNAVRNALPGRPGANVATLSTKLDVLDRKLAEAGALFGTQCTTNPNASGCSGLRETLMAATPVVRAGEQGVIDFARGQISPQATPPVPTGTDGGGGSRPPVTPPVPEPPVPAGGGLSWESLFGGDQPWYQRPGYLVGGAVLLGGVAIVLAVSSGKTRSEA